MAIHVVRCTVSGATVTRVTDLEGRVTQLICSDYDEPTKTCRIRRATLGGGPLSQFLDRAAADTLDRRGTRCDLS
jgi:hypothetical protein